MTDRELMQQALEALNHVNVQDRLQIITALRERLAQPQMQPCAGRNCGSTNPNLHSAECFEDYEKTTGMNQWHGLTEEEIDNSYMFWVVDQHDVIGFGKSLETKLKRKNA